MAIKPLDKYEKAAEEIGLKLISVSGYKRDSGAITRNIDEVTELLRKAFPEREKAPFEESGWH